MSYFTTLLFTLAVALFTIVPALAQYDSGSIGAATGLASNGHGQFAAANSFGPVGDTEGATPAQRPMTYTNPVQALGWASDSESAAVGHDQGYDQGYDSESAGRRRALAGVLDAILYARNLRVSVDR